MGAVQKWTNNVRPHCPQIEAGGSVSALSAGFQFGVGIQDGEFYYNSGFAVLFGYDFYIRIKFA